MIETKTHKKVLVAPLNWGLGHATRCIPIIKALLEFGCQPILGGDGASLDLLRKEFPSLDFYELPSSGVAYAKSPIFLKYKLLLQSPKIIRTIAAEKKCVEEIHKRENLQGIISDNRFGLRSDKVPSVYISHQLNVLSGNTSYLTTKAHRYLISKFDECWIPDFRTSDLSGELSKNTHQTESIKYIGPLSRFTRQKADKKQDIIAILSGPEPQRSMLEEKLRSELKSFKGKAMIIQGLVADKQRIRIEGNLSIVNYMLHTELRDAIESSRLVVSRSGYSSIMDLYALEAKAFFIPTPGQFEQEYLARHLKKLGIANFADQNNFILDDLKANGSYQGFKAKKTSKNYLNRSLLDVFD